MKSLGSFATITKKLPPHLHPAPQRTWGTHRMPSWENQINVAEKAPGRLVIKLFQKINGKSGREAAVNAESLLTSKSKRGVGLQKEHHLEVQ